jgi:hypothetical protein
MPSAGDVLITGIGTAISAAVTAGVNAFIQSRKKHEKQTAALAELVIAVELVSGELDPESRKVLQAKVAAARAVLG